MQVAAVPLAPSVMARIDLPSARLEAELVAVVLELKRDVLDEEDRRVVRERQRTQSWSMSALHCGLYW